MWVNKCPSYVLVCLCVLHLGPSLPSWTSPQFEDMLYKMKHETAFAMKSVLVRHFGQTLIAFILQEGAIRK